MSKSLGTGIDPVEMIDKYGADATRFGLLLMSSSQDVRFSEEKIAMGRNFANKLWNAGRLVLLAADGAPPARSDDELVDRWITSRLARATARWARPSGPATSRRPSTSSTTSSGTRSATGTSSSSRRASTATIRAVRARAAGHAMFVLDGVVRLAHPFLPFVSEEIASHYGAAPLLEQRLRRGRPRRRCGADDEAALARLQAAVQALRIYRAEQRIAPGQVLRAAFVADDGGAPAGELYESFADAFRALARIELGQRRRDGDGEAAARTVVLAPGGRFEVAAPTSTAARSANGCAPRSPSSKPRSRAARRSSPTRASSNARRRP